MAYYTFRSSESGLRNAYRYTVDSVDRLRRHLDDDAAPVHIIGGLAEESTPDDYLDLERAARATEALGWSVYDYATTGSWAWPYLRGEVPVPTTLAPPTTVAPTTVPPDHGPAGHGAAGDHAERLSGSRQGSRRSRSAVGEPISARTLPRSSAGPAAWRGPHPCTRSLLPATVRSVARGAPPPPEGGRRPHRGERGHGFVGRLRDGHHDGGRCGDVHRHQHRRRRRRFVASGDPRRATATTGPDIIDFGPAAAGTITLADHLPHVSDDVDIQGPGADVLTVDGAGFNLFGFERRDHEHDLGSDAHRWRCRGHLR